ncbi:MAG: PspC domain-containing protein [Intrasporangium sp.]|uniref:PspC domain-containing protein n=1 Tax=Intrasporangium sp. TaxID=1925024 RepID=UPI0026488F41|nr:PspC domain-containing protein [Intrasporangium sp.]MDN5797723.1 PspC domain-containing protein [Intrasporangium sp.]
MAKKSSSPPHGLDGFYAALRRPGITRTSDGRWFAGVAAGLARRLGVDPLVVRGAFILFGLFFGMGVALYLVCWLLMPDEKGKLPIEAALKYGDGGSIFLMVVTGIALFGGGPWGNGDLAGFRAVGLVALLAGAWWFLTQTDSGRDLLHNRRGSSQDSTAPPASDVSTGNAAAAAGASFTAPDPAPGTAPEPAPVWTPGTATEPTPVWTPGSAAYPTPEVRVRAIGFAAGLLILGLATIVGVLVHGIAGAAGWGGSHLGTAFAAGLGTLGLGLVVAGLAGRRSGWLTPFAVFGTAATLLTLVVPQGMTMPFRVGDVSHTVTSLNGDNRFELGLGNLTVDLSGADYRSTPVSPDIVHTAVGLGELDLVVPKGVNVLVHASAKAGELQASDPSAVNGTAAGASQLNIDGTNWDRTLRFGRNEPPQIEVFAEVGVGQITVSTASAP